MKKFVLAFLGCLLFLFTWAGSPIDGLKTDRDKLKFAESQFEISVSHRANAGQTQNVKMNGSPIDKSIEYSKAKKIAVLGLTVAFTSKDGSSNRDEKSYGGIPVEHFEELSQSVLQALYSSLEAQGYSVVKLDEVMKAPSYSKINFGFFDDSQRYSSNAWVCTPYKSKWIEPDNVNSIKSGISLVHKDTLKARALNRNKPFQDVVREVGADAGVNIVVRYYVYGGDIRIGWGPLKRGYVIDLLPAAGDPCIVWSKALKSDVELGVGIKTFDKKSGLTQKSWKYNLKASIPGLIGATKSIIDASVLDFKKDQQGKK